MPFINRAEELTRIRAVLTSRRPELYIVYGRRGVGKSTLLKEALANHHHLYYQATTQLLPQQLEDLTAAFRAFAPEAIVGGTLASLDHFLAAIEQYALGHADQPTVIVLDELPYLAHAEPAAPSIIQRWWDRVRQAGHFTHLTLFLLGSVVSWMERETLSEHGPLHNRRTGQLKLGPLDYVDAARFYPRYSPIERVRAYAIWGGLPSYLDEMDPTRPIWDNVRERILFGGARLAEEPRWLRFSDLRHEALYASLLRAIAQGKAAPGKIARRVGRNSASEIAHALNGLVDLGLVRRMVPVHEEGQDRARSTIYQVADNYVAFWYQLVEPVLPRINRRQYDRALADIQQRFDDYVAGQAFEDICRHYLFRALEARKLPDGLDFDTVGSWWASRDDEQDQVDVLATLDKRGVLAGECKWSASPFGPPTGVSAGIRRAAARVEFVAQPWHVLFSRSGFDARLAQEAQEPGRRLLLVEPRNLYDLETGRQPP